jgi:hypothetical protein
MILWMDSDFFSPSQNSIHCFGYDSHRALGIVRYISTLLKVAMTCDNELNFKIIVSELFIVSYCT